MTSEGTFLMIRHVRPDEGRHGNAEDDINYRCMKLLRLVVDVRQIERIWPDMVAEPKRQMFM